MNRKNVHQAVGVAFAERSAIAVGQFCRHKIGNTKNRDKTTATLFVLCRFYTKLLQDGDEGQKPSQHHPPPVRRRGDTDDKPVRVATCGFHKTFGLAFIPFFSRTIYFRLGHKFG
ncbi:MAG: hypothetical protein AB1349_07985, partial [Elusimicrobiota bacterium]